MEILSEKLLGLFQAGDSSAALIFLILQIASCVLLLPGGILTLTAGGVFGIVKGSAIVFLGTNVGAVLAFLVARHFFHGFAERKLNEHPRLKRIESAVNREGWKAVMLIRLCPIFPFRLTNYALGASHLKLRDFCVGSLIGTLPSTIAYVTLGTLNAQIIDHVQDGNPDRILPLAMGAVGLIAFFILLYRLSQESEKALEQRAQ